MLCANGVSFKLFLLTVFVDSFFAFADATSGAGAMRFSVAINASILTLDDLWRPLLRVASIFGS